jgi:hypothetical protein
MLSQTVCCAGRVAAHEDLDTFDVLLWDLTEREVKHCLVILGCVRARVPRPPYHTQRLSGLIGVGLKWVKPEPALVVVGSLLLSGCTVMSVAFTSIVKDSGAPCCQKRSRACACALRSASSMPGSRAIFSISRYVVESEATMPNSASWSRTLPMSDTHSPPSASITTRSRITRLGSWPR